jgi:hypothetical protein
MTGTSPFTENNGSAVIQIPGYTTTTRGTTAIIHSAAGDGGSEMESGVTYVGYHPAGAITQVTVGNGGNTWNGCNIRIYGMA